MADSIGNPNPGDVAEFYSGQASSGDKREMGFRLKGGRLVPGKRTPSKVARAFNRGRATKRKTVRARGRQHN